MEQSWKKIWIMHWRRLITKNWIRNRKGTNCSIFQERMGKNILNYQLWGGQPVWIWRNWEKNTMQRWMLPMTMVQHKLLSNLTSWVKLWKTKKEILWKLVNSNTCLRKNLRHWKRILMTRGKNKINILKPPNYHIKTWN